MTDKPEDPNAFPYCHGEYFQNGMTLRDYFAGQALIGCLGNPTNKKICEAVQGQPLLKNIQFDEALANMAYLYADAMLKARLK